MVAEKINMTYDICLTQDGEYGQEMPDKSWNGMIGDLLDNVSWETTLQTSISNTSIEN